MPDLGSAIDLYQNAGSFLIYLLLIAATALAVCIPWQAKQPRGKSERVTYFLMTAISALLAAGSILVIWFHWEIYQHVVLRLPENLAHEINRWLAMANSRSSYTLPLYDPAAPPRYVLPFWLENEKYLFWFLAYAGMALFAWRRLSQPIFRILLQVLLVVQVAVLCLAWNSVQEAKHSTKENLKTFPCTMAELCHKPLSKLLHFLVVNLFEQKPLISTFYTNARRRRHEQKTEDSQLKLYNF